MNMLMINTLRESIYNELNAVHNIAEVFDGIPQKFWGFPSIYFVFDRIESTVSDSNHHERIYYFQINVFQETTTLWNVQSEKILCEVIDEIIDRFDRAQLHEDITYIEAVWGNIQAVETDNGPAFHGMILLGIHVPFTLSL